jgi:hypothetical protein
LTRIGSLRHAEQILNEARMAETTRTTSHLSFHTDHPPLELATQEFVDGATVRSSKINELTVGAARATLVAMQAKPNGKPVTLAQTIVAPVGPKGFVGLHLLRPPGIPNRLPVIMLFHGGEWALGDASLNNVRPPPPADRCRDQCAWAFVCPGAREQRVRRHISARGQGPGLAVSFSPPAC